MYFLCNFFSHIWKRHCMITLWSMTITNNHSKPAQSLPLRSFHENGSRCMRCMLSLSQHLHAWLIMHFVTINLPLIIPKKKKIGKIFSNLYGESQLSLAFNLHPVLSSWIGCFFLFSPFLFFLLEYNNASQRILSQSIYKEGARRKEGRKKQMP